MGQINSIKVDALMMNKQVFEYMWDCMNMPEGLEGNSEARCETSVLSLGISELVADLPNTAAGDDKSVSLA